MLHVILDISRGLMRGQIKTDQAKSRPIRGGKALGSALLSLVLCCGLLQACTPSSLSQGQKGGSEQDSTNTEEAQVFEPHYNKGFGPPTVPNRYLDHYLDLFNTVTTLIGFEKTEEEFKEKAERLHDFAWKYHRQYDGYVPYSEVSNVYALNEKAGKGPQKISPELMDLLLFGKKMYEETEGKLNIALGAVTNLWQAYREKALALSAEEREKKAEDLVPKEEELRQAAEHIHMEDLLLDPIQGTAELKDPDMSLDVGAIAKGFAVQALTLYAENELQLKENWLISAGGSNVRAIGGKPAEKGQVAWLVGLRDPRGESEGAYKHLLFLDNQSLVTSGDYERYYEVQGKRYHHIIDPSTLYPATYYQAVSVIMDDSGIADALSTALFTLPLEEGKALALRFGAEVLWELPDGTTEMTEGFRKHIQSQRLPELEDEPSDQEKDQVPTLEQEEKGEQEDARGQASIIPEPRPART